MSQDGLDPPDLAKAEQGFELLWVILRKHRIGQSGCLKQAKVMHD